MADPTTKIYWLVPYRDTATREATIMSAQSQVAASFQTYIGGVPRVRDGYWYDLQQAGASAYSGSNQLTFAASSNKYGFPYAVTLPITIPQSKAFDFYGIADYAASPVLQAFQLTQRDVAFPLVYLSPDLYTNADHKAILNGAFPAVKQNDNVTLTLYGTAASTEPIDVLFTLAEQAAQTS